MSSTPCPRLFWAHECVLQCPRWVFSRALRQNQHEVHGVYKPSVYSSKSPSKNWSISYADGTSASGDVYYDVVGIDDVWVMQQAVEVATKISTNLERDDGLDGILGLGFSNLNRGMSCLHKTPCFKSSDNQCSSQTRA